MLEDLNYSRLFGSEGGVKEVVYTLGYYGDTFKREIIDWFTCGGIKRGTVVALDESEQLRRKESVAKIIGREKMEILVGLADVSLNCGYNAVGSSIIPLESVACDSTKIEEFGQDIRNALEDLYFFCGQYVRAIESGLYIGYKCRDEVDQEEVVEWLCDAIGSISGRKDKDKLIEALKEAYNEMQAAYSYREDLLCETDDEDNVSDNDLDLIEESIERVQKSRKKYFGLKDKAEECGIDVDQYIK